MDDELTTGNGEAIDTTLGDLISAVSDAVEENVTPSRESLKRTQLVLAHILGKTWRKKLPH